MCYNPRAESGGFAPNTDRFLEELQEHFATRTGWNSLSKVLNVCVSIPHAQQDRCPMGRPLQFYLRLDSPVYSCMEANFALRLGELL